MKSNELTYAHALLSFNKYHIHAGRAAKGMNVQQHTIAYVHAGSGIVHLERNGQATSYPLEPGNCYHLEPFTHATAILDDNVGTIELYLLRYAIVPLPTSSKTPSSSSHADDTLQPVVKVNNQAELLTLLIAIQEALLQQSTADLRVQLHFHELLYLLKQCADIPQHDAVDSTIRYIQENSSSPLSTAALSQMAGMTSSAYCKAFKKITGKTPSQYWTELRLRKAKELLDSAGKRGVLKQIARSVGYHDELYFSRLFKRAEGISPTEFIRRRQCRVAVVSHLFLQDHFLAFGIKPIAAPSSPSIHHTASGFPHYLHSALGGTLPLNIEQTICPHRVQQLDPDIVIKMNFRQNPNDSHWQRASNIVYFDSFYNWHEYVRAIGQLLHKQEQAEHIIQQINRAEAEGKDSLRAATRRGKWAIIRVLPDDIRIYGIKNHALSDLFYNKLGFVPDEHITHSFYQTNGLIDLVNWNPPNIIIIWSERGDVNRLSLNPLWQELRAVKENRVYMPDSKLWDPWGPTGRVNTLRACVQYFNKLGMT